jgi:transcriptional regulator with PAS, ATPase and Fis domain
MERTRVLHRDLAIQRLIEGRAAFPTIITTSPVMREVAKLVDRVSTSHSAILLLGESGTGKELVARTIHLKSPRRRACFLALNCATLPESLLESELFGHEKGAFTGADELRMGLFEVAHTGTLFLDEIGEMSPACQAHLLRVLEAGEFRRVGGRTNLHTDVRLIAATNRDPAVAIQEGRLRQDLYFRLNTVTIVLPPLRNRKEDIWPLAQYFLQIISREMVRKISLSEDVRPAFERYSWPGNVRELRNMIERLVLLVDHEEIRLTDIPYELAVPATSASSERPLSLGEVEKQHILKILAGTRGNRREASRILGISEPTLYRKLSQYGVGPIKM